MHILQIHRQTTYGHNNQYLTQPKTFRVYDSSSRKEQTNQMEVQSRTGTINPGICPEDKTSKPSVNPIIGDVPNMTCNEMKTESNPNKSFTSAKDVDSSNQGERFSDIKSDLTEESHHVRTQTIYSSHNQNIHSMQLHRQATYGHDEQYLTQLEGGDKTQKFELSVLHLGYRSFR